MTPSSGLQPFFAPTPPLFFFAGAAFRFFARPAFLEPILFNIPEKLLIIIWPLDRRALLVLGDAAVALVGAGAERAPQQIDGEDDQSEE